MKPGQKHLGMPLGVKHSFAGKLSAEWTVKGWKDQCRVVRIGRLPTRGEMKEELFHPIDLGLYEWKKKIEYGADSPLQERHHLRGTWSVEILRGAGMFVLTAPCK